MRLGDSSNRLLLFCLCLLNCLLGCWLNSWLHNLLSYWLFNCLGHWLSRSFYLFLCSLSNRLCENLCWLSENLSWLWHNYCWSRLGTLLNLILELIQLLRGKTLSKSSCLLRLQSIGLGSVDETQSLLESLFYLLLVRSSLSSNILAS